MKSKNNISKNFLIGCMMSLAFITILFLTQPAKSQSVTEIYTAGNEMYKAKQYENAAADYEKIISQGYKTAEVYYNLGNCYFKLNNIAKSILNYERALKLSPADEDVLHNLELAKSRATDRIQPVPQLSIITSWNHFLTTFNSNGWATVTIILIWIGLIVFAISLFRKRKSFFNTAAILLFIFSIAAMSIAFNQKHVSENSGAAILMVSNSFVKSAPDVNAGNLFMIHEGTKLLILDHVGEWNKIRLEDGKVGWIEKISFEFI